MIDSPKQCILAVLPKGHIVMLIIIIHFYWPYDYYYCYCYYL